MEWVRLLHHGTISPNFKYCLMKIRIDLRLNSQLLRELRCLVGHQFNLHQCGLIVIKKVQRRPRTAQLRLQLELTAKIKLLRTVCKKCKYSLVLTSPNVNLFCFPFFFFYIFWHFMDQTRRKCMFMSLLVVWICDSQAGVLLPHRATSAVTRRYLERLWGHLADAKKVDFTVI